MAKGTELRTQLSPPTGLGGSRASEAERLCVGDMLGRAVCPRSPCSASRSSESWPLCLFPAALLPRRPDASLCVCCLFISEFIALESTSRAGSRKAWLRGQQASTGRAGVKARPLSAATRPGQVKAGTVVPSPEPPRCGCSGQHVPKKRLPAAEPDRGLASPVTPWSRGGRCDSHTHIQVAD